MDKRRIAVFTGTRAEYGLLRRVLLGLERREDCELVLLVSGSHLSRRAGYTLAEIQADGFSPAACIDLELEGRETSESVCGAMGRAVSGTGRALCAFRPHVLTVLGDRYETFCAVAAAQAARVPVAHIHGGETTEGAMDEAFRHAITKMSHIHFTSCEDYRQRVIQLGESPDRVRNVGALGVENIRLLDVPDEADIRSRLDMADGRPYLLCTLHPVTLADESPAAQARSVLEALEAFPGHAVVFTGANADPGGSDINDMLLRRAREHPDRYRFFPSLGVRNYLAAAGYSACVLGNSSSGIIEVPSLGTPVVDIGDRQKGRIRAASVLHCPQTAGEIAETVRRALSPEHRELAGMTRNPYERENTAETIVECLRSWPLDGILMKSFYNLPPVGAP